MHMFCEHNIVISLRKQLKTYFNENLRLPTLSPKIGIFEIFNETVNDRIVISILLLVPK